jgi:serine/threonine protein kinase
MVQLLRHKNIMLPFYLTVVADLDDNSEIAFSSDSESKIQDLLRDSESKDINVERRINSGLRITFGPYLQGTLSGYVMPYGDPLTGRNVNSIDSIYRVIYSVASALSYLHDKGIIFMDLKTDNIVLVRNVSTTSTRSRLSTVKLIDFGGCEYVSNMCTHYRQTYSDDHTIHCKKPCIPSSACVTPLYSSSEQWTGSHCLRTPHDIWCLGIIFSQLLYDAHPYTEGRWGSFKYPIRNNSSTTSDSPDTPYIHLRKVIGRSNPQRTVDTLRRRYRQGAQPKLVPTIRYEMVTRGMDGTSIEINRDKDPTEIIYHMVCHNPFERPTASEITNLILEMLAVNSFS